jgi:hypothetical protein
LYQNSPGFRVSKLLSALIVSTVVAVSPAVKDFDQKLFPRYEKTVPKSSIVDQSFLQLKTVPISRFLLLCMICRWVKNELDQLLRTAEIEDRDVFEIRFISQ